jgi:hypothetical protein
MRRPKGSILVLLLTCAFCVAQPTSVPSTAPAVEVIYLDGEKVRFTPPPGLTFQGHLNDGRAAGFSIGDTQALISVLVTPQEQALPRGFSDQLARFVRKNILDEAQQGQQDIVMQPRVEDDERFLLRVHDKFNTEERFGDRVHLYRAVGLYLVSVTATAFTEDEAEARRVHELGADLLLSVRLNLKPRAARNRPPAGTDRPVMFANAKIRLTPPPGWKGELNDNAEGIIVSYEDPKDAANCIAISVRQLPPEARRDPKIRDILIDEIVDGERQAFKVEGAEIVGQTQTIEDRRFLRKTRTDYEHEGRKFRVTSRQVRAGNAVVSVTMLAGEDAADEVDELGDRVATSVRPLASR